MYLLDTNICSLVIQENPIIIAHIKAVEEVNTAISIITVGELYYMVEKSKYKEANLTLVNQFLDDIRVYYIDDKTSKIYGQIKAYLINKYAPKEKNKRKKTKITELGFDENDLWISAIAVNNNLTMVSNDTDFDRIKTVANFNVEKWKIN